MIPSTDTPLQTSAIDEAELAEVEREIRERKTSRLQQVRQQLSTEQGRKWVWDELTAHGLFEDISGPIEVVYSALGRRREGIRLFMEVNRHPELYLQMQAEAIKRDRDARRARSRREPRRSSR